MERKRACVFVCWCGDHPHLITSHDHHAGSQLVWSQQYYGSMAVHLAQVCSHMCNSASAKSINAGTLGNIKHLHLHANTKLKH